ncbi:CDF family Co(II)/Ni(II) efflux transporter DmeF [Azospira restricta]|uniref:CDF family Co(II)/Ni(II) efflux transporter DmeF n=1 Tax=Azospira restricta TaxID=404405 RepID=A0A974SQU4_9RHOO|nr:CDF family Co(II)/Ni(II) efflux transporter DmeF [Azospira restricta]QRJ64734.1 CDF family Co(II)/Ni(II) efflux transporter DmeF [Azospira restricta]
MHEIDSWRHPHLFDTGNPAAERGARLVMWITFAAMIGEIVAGLVFNSMALLADGWHMATHAFAIGLSAFAYAMARRYAHDARFAFGTWKIEILAGFTSALFLLGVAGAMVWESVRHLLDPQPIRFAEAMVVAALGLAVNVVCALILGNAHHHHGHDHEHGHAHPHDHGHDLNLRSAYLHVLADAATSLLAIAALAGGLWLGWDWLDPLMGIVGAVLITVWAWSLARDAGRVLLDCEMDHPVVAEVREVIEAHPQWAATTRIADLHVWRVGKGSFAVILGLVTHDATLSAEAVRGELARHAELVHVSVEINRCGCDEAAA